MAVSSEIRQRIEETAFVDTHEHLWEESLRLDALEKGGDGGLPAPDFGMLLARLPAHDLLAAGMPSEDCRNLFSHDLAPSDKWKLLAPWYEQVRNTGYFAAVLETIRVLAEEDDLRAETVGPVSERLRKGIKPGFYEAILTKTARVEYAQVHSKDDLLFRETRQPQWLAQDLNLSPLATTLDVYEVARLAEREVRSLFDWQEVIEWCFATYGPRAIAVKSTCAHSRRLNFEPVSAAQAAAIFDRFLAGPDTLAPPERKALQDHLFHYCVRQAIAHGLPIKIHTGYLTGTGHMDLDPVRRHAADLCRVLVAYPDARFVMMHANYPYGHEAIALAKHFANVYVDMSRVWAVNPAAAVRFAKEFLTAAPAGKLLTFGGDAQAVEMVAGNAALARKGLCQALSELVDEGWIRPAAIDTLIENLMRGNAHALFDYEGTLKNWSTCLDLEEQLAQ